MGRNQFLIAIGLGVVAAVVFASATTGPVLIRYALFLLTSLPIFLAGLGWGWRMAALAGTVSVALVALGGGALPAAVFAITQVVPPVILCYLALLSRVYQPEGAANETIEWYPPGRLVLWSAVMAGLLTLAILMLTAENLDAVKASIREYVESTLKSGLGPAGERGGLDDTQLSSLTDMIVALMPAASSVSWMTALVFNLWLAGRITLASGQLGRPWPDIAALEYPTGTALMFLASILLSGASGLAGAAGTGFFGAFFLAYVLAGLAVIHYLTRGKPWRSFALWGLYIGLFVINVWIAAIVALVGLADGPFKLRQRSQAPGPPPTDPSASI